MSALSVAEALARCAVTGTWAQGMCGQFCAAMYGYEFSGYRDAVTQWEATPSRLRHNGSDAPAGALVFWGGGSAGHGHVAIADGLGDVWSIDICGAGTVCHVPAGTISIRWGLPHLGWSWPYFQGEEWSPQMIKGVDVSRFQAVSGWESGIDFGFTKVTQGTSYVNSSWVGQRDTVRSVGAVVGYYHFLEKGNIVPQADFFLSKIALQPGDVLACDWETNPNTGTGATSAEKDAWISYVQGKTGHRVILYCNKDYWINRDTTSFAGDGLWIATAGAPAGQPGITAPWLIHQYSTAGNLDHDVAQFASRADMIEWAGGDMALSTDDKTWIKATIVQAIKDNAAAAVLNTDGLLAAPADAPDKATNPFWTLASYIRDTGGRSRAAAVTLANILLQAQTNGGGISEAKTTLGEIKAVLDSLDLSQLPADVAAKIESLKISVGFTEGV